MKNSGKNLRRINYIKVSVQYIIVLMSLKLKPVLLVLTVKTRQGLVKRNGPTMYISVILKTQGLAV